MKEAVLCLGSNLKEREENLKKAILGISNLPKTEIIKISSIYSTVPFLVPDKQDDYLNCCVKIKTELLPETLLGCCLGIESAMGRKRTYRNAARIIDIDLLLFEGITCCTKDLILPHPRIRDRAFVMVPLSELYENKNALGFDFKSALDEVDTGEISFFKSSESF